MTYAKLIKAPTDKLRLLLSVARVNTMAPNFMTRSAAVARVDAIQRELARRESVTP